MLAGAPGFSADASAAIWPGRVPQQPPTIDAPLPCHLTPCCAYAAAAMTPSPVSAVSDAGFSYSLRSCGSGQAHRPAQTNTNFTLPAARAPVRALGQRGAGGECGDFSRASPCLATPRSCLGKCCRTLLSSRRCLPPSLPAAEGPRRCSPSRNNSARTPQYAHETRQRTKGKSKAFAISPAAPPPIAAASGPCAHAG